MTSSITGDNGFCAAVIGSPYEELTINQNATNSTIEEFNKLKVGGVSGELSASGGSYVALLGSGHSGFMSNRGESNIQ